MRFVTTRHTKGPDPLMAFRAPTELLDELDARRSETGQTRSDAVREALRNWLAEGEAVGVEDLEVATT